MGVWGVWMWVGLCVRMGRYWDVVRVSSKHEFGTYPPSLTQAERELHLVDKVEEWQVWEPLVVEPPPTQWKWP